MANLFDVTNAPSVEPEHLVIGDFVQWKRTDLFADYPDSAYSVQYVSRKSAGGGDHEFIVVGSVTGTDWIFQIASATSANFEASDHHWQLEVIRTSDSSRIVLERGHWKIFEDLDVNADPRTHAETMVDKIESLLEGRADSDVDSYSIAGRSLSKLSFEELIKARDYFRSEVKQEKAAELAERGLNTGATIQVRF